ncbi:ATP-binding cassette sub- G member 1 [Dinochytrium kinnereticum]|nr:ATP-binding cassette sub- G member 1 [Dinochytrium kinnereticum]
MPRPKSREITPVATDGEVETIRMPSLDSDRVNNNTACEITFRNLTFSIGVVATENKRKFMKEKVILKASMTAAYIFHGNIQDISGVFRPGRFTAIMGASGAGKTSFLNVIAGEAKFGKISGDILVNGAPVTGSGIKKISGFVFQDDVILATMTVREAITMSATLRLPDTISEADKKAKVEQIIRDLNLTKCSDTVIGDFHIKGVSGGERKRCAMAMVGTHLLLQEMVTNPKVLFLDEPTSGLDTFTAFSVIHTLRDLAHRRNQTYIATIHQPSSQVFRLFDDLLLLSDGRVMYYGPTSEAVNYFASHSYRCPIRSNPADFFFYHILNNQDGVAMPTSGDNNHLDGGHDADEVEELDETNGERIERMLEAWQASPENIAVMKNVESPSISGGIPNGTARYLAPAMVQFKFLFDRESKNSFRDPLVLRSRLVQTVFISLIVGLLYLNNTSLPQNAMGVIFFIAVMNFMLSTQAHLSSFGKQKAVFAREHGGGYYGLAAFFSSRVLVEMPLQIIFPWLQVTMVYYMSGFEVNAGKYFVMCVFAILSSVSGFAMGVCLACAFSNLAVALNTSTTLLLPMMLLSGLFINSSAMPNWISWLQYLTPIKYAFEGILKSQISGTRGGDQLIKSLFGKVELSVLTCGMLLLAIALSLFLLAYFNLYLLVSKKSKVARVSVKKA